MFQHFMKTILKGPIPLFIFIVSLIMGFMALQWTPREEEPQIVVPVVDVLVEAPGLSAKQIEHQITTPLEKLLSQISGVKHIYSTTSAGRSTVTLRFHVGEDREDAIFNTYNKLYSNQDQVPAVVSRWLVKPVEVDDVPILLLALWSDTPETYSDFDLRRVAEELATDLQTINNTSQVNVVGGRPRTINVHINPESLSARQTTAADIVFALQASNALQDAGQWTFNNQSIQLQSGDFIRSINELRNTVINVINGAPVYLQDVATIVDGPDHAENYTWINFTEHYQKTLLPQGQTENKNHQHFPMVAISIAKQRGSNAVTVANDVHHLLNNWQQRLLPAEIQVEVIRDYGQTANEKVNNLTSSLGFAIVTVIIFIGVFLGWRPALVVGLAVPICYGVTLALDFAFGYTINRVTLFALVLSLGLLVDDPITGVDNISRFLKNGRGSVADRITAAMMEIRTPLVMSTITIILAFIPLAFITGMMGPYMAPMAFNVPVSVITSTVVAFLLTPWLAQKLLPGEWAGSDKNINQDIKPTFNEQGFYPRWLKKILENRRYASRILWATLTLFFIAAMLPVLRLVPLKLLPFDNKNEIQIVIDMPEGSSLEHTAAISTKVINTVRLLPEVEAIATFVGVPSPIDFNGMVRQYYNRMQPNFADVRITLSDKTQRKHQSHSVVLRLRELIKTRLAQDIVNHDVKIKVVEVPPGPPVLSTLVAEIYGDLTTPYETQRIAAKLVEQRLQKEPHVVEIDSTVEANQKRWRFVTDKQKAALSGIATTDINQLLSMANQGYVSTYLPFENESSPLPIKLRLSESEKLSANDFTRLQLKGRANIVKISSPQGLDSAPQPMVALGELGTLVESTSDKNIYHKDLKPVVYVTAELSGRTPAEIIADIHSDFIKDSKDPITKNRDISNWEQRTYLTSGGNEFWNLPEGTSIKWRGEGEWKVTVDVFRDMGLAFAFALIAIFFVLHIQTKSPALSLIIMSAIPLTIIGIMPGFWILNIFGEREVAGSPDPILFTATAMIGMIALAGIVVRNSLILVEFITQERSRGRSIKDALIMAGSVRMRPVLLTAGTTMLGNLVIILDPVFSGLALAIIFGIIASTLLTLVIVPIVYFLVFDKGDN